MHRLPFLLCQAEVILVLHNAGRLLSISRAPEMLGFFCFCIRSISFLLHSRSHKLQTKCETHCIVTRCQQYTAASAMQQPSLASYIDDSLCLSSQHR